jgi:hypothetical protein
MSERQIIETAAYPDMVQEIGKGAKEIQALNFKNAVLASKKTRVFELLGMTGTGKTETAKEMRTLLVKSGHTVGWYEHNKGVLVKTEYEDIIADLRFIIQMGGAMEAVLIIDEYPIPAFFRSLVYYELNNIAAATDMIIIFIRQTNDKALILKPIGC